MLMGHNFFCLADWGRDRCDPDRALGIWTDITFSEAGHYGLAFAL